MANKLLATVDIGSMSCIMLIAAFEEGKLVPKLQKVKICKLGEDIYEHGRITEKKIQELVDVMTSFRMDLHALGADIQAAAMTEAMRKAENQEEVVDAVEKALWFRPRIISGEEEGKLTYRSVKEWHGEGIVTIDIGGGSTELSNGETTFSIPVGALKMFKAMGPIPGPEYKKFVKETFKEVSFKGMTKKPVYLIGGTGTALAMVYLDKQYGTGVPSSPDAPCPTIETVPKVKPVTVHFLDNQYGNSRCSSIDQPSGTVTANPKQCLVEAVRGPRVMSTNFHNVGASVDEPCQVITANRKWHYLVNPQFTCPGNSIEEPCPTVIARQDKKPLSLAEVKTSGSLPSFIKKEDGTLVYEIYDTDSDTLKQIKLFMCAHGIVDITMRMLRIKELKLIQVFPEDYVLMGTQEEQKKYLGNAVVTIMAKVWCEAIADNLARKTTASVA